MLFLFFQVQQTKPVREWDVGKRESGMDRSRERERSKEHVRDRNDRNIKKRTPDRDYGRDRERKRSHSSSPCNYFKYLIYFK